MNMIQIKKTNPFDTATSKFLTHIDNNRKFNVIVCLIYIIMYRQKTKDHERKQKYIAYGRRVTREKTVKKSIQNNDNGKYKENETI